MSTVDTIISGSTLIVFVMLLRIFAGKWLPRRLFPLMWLTAALRLLFPFHLESNISIWNIWKRDSISIVVNHSLAAMNLSATESAFALPQAGTIPDNSACTVWFTQQTLLVIWGIVSVVLILFFTLTYFRNIHLFRQAQPAESARIAVLLSEFGFMRPVRVKKTSDTRAPLTYGIFQPVVLLPDALCSNSDCLDYILSHELTHVRWFDCLQKLIMTAVLCIHWWNPLVWCMARFANRDIELACDEATVSRFDSDRRKAYALLLIQLEESRLHSMPFSSNFKKNITEERIQMIIKGKKTSFIAGMAAVILAIGSVPVFAAEPPANSHTNTIQANAFTKAPSNIAPNPEHLPEDASDMDDAASVTTEINQETPESATEENASEIWLWPLEDTSAKISAAFGARIHPVTGAEIVHNGLDIIAPQGAAIYAMRSGTVVEAGFDAAKGNYVVIDHGDSYQTIYQHCSTLLVSQGNTITQGTQIAQVGATGAATGAHLHFSITYQGEYLDPASIQQ